MVHQVGHNVSYKQQSDIRVKKRAVLVITWNHRNFKFKTNNL